MFCISFLVIGFIHFSDQISFKTSLASSSAIVRYSNAVFAALKIFSSIFSMRAFIATMSIG